MEPLEHSDYEDRSKNRGRIDLDEEDDEQEEPIVRKQSESPSETANKAKKFYKRSYVPSAEQSLILKQFLKPGKNEISFQVLK